MIVLQVLWTMGALIIIGYAIFDLVREVQDDHRR